MLKIRWMVRMDLPSILEIEKSSFPTPWSEEEFIQFLRQRNTIGMVCELNDEHVVGFMIYELHNRHVYLLKMAVTPTMRRKRVGSVMTERLLTKLCRERRNQIALDVRETNLPAQLFFRQLGFKAVTTYREYYEDTGEDAYLMLQRYKEPSVPIITQPEHNTFKLFQNWFRQPK